MIDVAHESNDGSARLEFLLFRWLRRWRSNNNLFFLVNTAAFFTALFLQKESVPLRNLGRHIGLDRLVGVYENVEIIHQLLDQLKIFHPELLRQLFCSDRRLDFVGVLMFFLFEWSNF